MAFITPTRVFAILPIHLRLGIASLHKSRLGVVQELRESYNGILYQLDCAAVVRNTLDKGCLLLLPQICTLLHAFLRSIDERPKGFNFRRLRLLCLRQSPNCSVCHGDCMIQVRQSVLVLILLALTAVTVVNIILLLFSKLDHHSIDGSNHLVEVPSFCICRSLEQSEAVVVHCQGLQTRGCLCQIAPFNVGKLQEALGLGAFMCTLECCLGFIAGEDLEGLRNARKLLHSKCRPLCPL
mmetsp:Transcript_103111/g.188168  ORF Transcript_103111/g.188168 Transcript_103111/m.188168 type:complete len:239 (-) Transcript_103111:1044-1760(-)